jgi:hypothetical protein
MKLIIYNKARFYKTEEENMHLPSGTSERNLEY